MDRRRNNFVACNRVNARYNRYTIIRQAEGITVSENASLKMESVLNAAQALVL